MSTMSAAVMFDDITSVSTTPIEGHPSWTDVKITVGTSTFSILLCPAGAAKTIAAAINSTLMPPEQPLKQRTPELVDEPTTFFVG